MGARGRAGAVLAAVVVAGTAWAAPSTAVTVGEEGCTPGYWKNHTSSWEEYAPGDSLTSVFPDAGRYASTEDATLLEALRFRGGAGGDGAARILLRAATAAVLNAAHDGVGYPYTRVERPDVQPLPPVILERVRDALAGGDRDTMLRLAGELDEANNLGCPL